MLKFAPCLFCLLVLTLTQCVTRPIGPRGLTKGQFHACRYSENPDGVMIGVVSVELSEYEARMNYGLQKLYLKAIAEGKRQGYGQVQITHVVILPSEKPKNRLVREVVGTQMVGGAVVGETVNYRHETTYVDHLRVQADVHVCPVAN